MLDDRTWVGLGVGGEALPSEMIAIDLMVERLTAIGVLITQRDAAGASDRPA